MLVTISYHSIGYGASMFAQPEFTNSEVVEVNSLEDPKLIEYIERQEDTYGNKFVEPGDLGYHFLSTQGGVKIAEYVAPKVKQL